MLTPTQIDTINSAPSTRTSDHVVDVEAWLERAASPVRAFAPGAWDYVPKHRGEPAPR